MTGRDALPVPAVALARRSRRPASLARAVTFVLLAAGAAVMLFPFLWMLSTSLKPSTAVLTMPPQLVPAEPTLQPYADVAATFPLVRVLLNSILVAVLTTGGQLLISAMAGYAFARLPFRGRGLLFTLYLATLMVPFAVTMTPLFIVVRYLGWTDSYLGLIVPGLFSAFGTYFMRQYFLGLPRELEEAAVLDGATATRTFFSVMLPQAGPALATMGVLGFMASWNSFLWPLLIVSNPNLMTLPLALSTLQGLHPGQTEWNMVMAGAVVSVVPMILVFLLAQKWVVAGMANAGLKG